MNPIIRTKKIIFLAIRLWMCGMAFIPACWIASRVFAHEGSI